MPQGYSTDHESRKRHAISGLRIVVLLKPLVLSQLTLNSVNCMSIHFQHFRESLQVHFGSEYCLNFVIMYQFLDLLSQVILNGI